MIPAKKYFGIGGFSSESLRSNLKPPKLNGCWSVPAKCGAAPAPLAAVSDATHSKPNTVSGITQRKDEWSGNGKIPRCLNGAKFEVVIPAVPLRSVPTILVEQKHEKPVSSHDEGQNKAKTTDNTVHQKEELWKHESDKLAAVLAEAKEFISLLDAKYSPPKTFPAKEDFHKNSGESKDQLPSSESVAFPLHTSIGQQNLVMGKSVMLQDSDGSLPRKRLKVNSGISVVVQEEKHFGTETILEDENEVRILSPAEWKVSQLCFNRKKDECVNLPIGDIERKKERRSSLKIDREGRNDIQPRGINIVDYIDLISFGTKSDQPSGRFANSELSENKCRDLRGHYSSDSDECSPPISEGEQDDALKMCSVEDEASATYSTNCQNHNELINLEIVQHDHPRGRKVMEALKLFKEEYMKILQDQELEMREGKITKGPHFVAAQRVREKGMIVSTDKPFGHIPGIEIGDEFSFRSELVVVGLNRQYTPGIDYVTVDGKKYATSVVNSGRYENEAKEHDVLIYSGQGGNPSVNAAIADQKLEKGNLALFNSMKMGFPVRVIHKRKCQMESKTLGGNDKRDYMYVYDGLYKVHRFWHERENQNCKLVYKFELRRLPGQPMLDGSNVELGNENFEVVNGLPGQPRRHGAFAELGKSNYATEVSDALQEKEDFESVNGLPMPQRNHGIDVKWCKQIQAMDICVLDDVSKGKEKFKVRAVNGVDDDLPPPFTYITNIIYPRWYWQSEPIGCDCTDGCSDSVQCPCVIKNGGEIPYTEKGEIMRAMTKKAVHECGPLCKCPPSCMNRVSQLGLCFQLEIFKTKSMGWGVRSRDYIMPGSFICEYIGELLGENEADQRIGNDQYLFDICHGKSKEDDFALDAAKCGNIGRFINHSCDPNVFAQKVLYDHNDMTMPHIMFFAGKRIPPGQELMYDYNYTKIRVRDANGNLRRKACHCGSRKCTGRLY